MPMMSFIASCISSVFLGWYSWMIAWVIAMLAGILLFLFDAIISLSIILVL